MISHPDYVPMTNLFMKFNWPEAVDKIWKAMQSHPAPLEKILLGMTPAENVEFDVFTSMHHDCYLSAPDGQVLRIDLSWLRGLIFQTSFSMPFHRLADLSRAGAFDLGDELKRKHRLVEPLSGSDEEVEREAESSGYIAGYTRLAPYFDRTAYTLDLSGLRLLAPILADPAEYLLQQVICRLERYEGWTICTSAAWVDSGEWEILLKHLLDSSLQNLRGPDASRSKNSGRPPVKYEAASKAYQEMFPDGHGDAPLKEVWRSVEASAGLPLSKSTILRVIKVSKDPQK